MNKKLSFFTAPLTKTLSNYSKRYSGSLLGLLISLTWHSSTTGGISEASHIQLGTKHIYLFGDLHEAGKPKDIDQQVTNLVNALEETSTYRTENLPILWEKAISSSPSNNNKSKRILADLETEIMKSKLANITIENAEIRQVAISIRTILKKAKTPQLIQTYPDGRYFDYKLNPTLTCSTITFKDLLDEYTTWMTHIKKFRKKHQKNQALKNHFDNKLEDAVEDFNLLEKCMKKNNLTENDNVLDYAIKTFLEDGMTAITWEEKHSTLRKAILDPFCSLFDLYLFTRVYDHQGNHIALVAGGHHTSEVEQMLLDQGALEKIYYVNPSTGILETEIQLLTYYEFTAILKGYCPYKYFKEQIVAPLVIRTLVIILNIQSPIDPNNNDKK